MSAASFTLTPTDFARLQKVVGRRVGRKPGLSSTLFMLRAAVWVGVGLLVAAYVRVLDDYAEPPHLRFMAYLVMIVFLLLVSLPHVSQAIWRKHMFAPSGTFLSPQTVSITDSALTIQSATMRSELLWAGFMAREEDDVNHYLFTDEMQAVVLPRSAVASFADEFERLTSHLKNKP